MKVVHLCNLPLPEDHPDRSRLATHPGRWALNLAIAQKNHTDVKPELVMHVPGASRDHHAEVEGISSHFIAAPDRFRSSTFFWWDARRLARFVAKLQPEVVHAHGTEDAYGLAAQRARLPCVITAQGLHFLINPILKPKLLSRERIVEFTEQFCLRRASHVIAKSRYVKDRLSQKFPRLVLHEIPNTYDPKLLEVHEKRESNAVIFVGTLNPRKGFHDLREAIKILREKIPGIHLWVMGDRSSPPGSYETYEKRSTRDLMGEQAHFFGVRSSHETASQVAKASVLVAPSLEEMFGNQVIEALLLGTPVVVTEGTAMAENVRRFGNGQVVPQADPPELAKAILKALSSSPSCETREGARRKIHDWMSPERVARLHREVYTTVLSGR